MEMAQAASLRMSNSAELRSCTSGGTMLASITLWIWSLFPAVMLEMVQHASFRIPFLGLPKSCSLSTQKPTRVHTLQSYQVETKGLYRIEREQNSSSSRDAKVRGPQATQKERRVCWCRQGSAQKLMMIWVCRSSPVTMLPTVRSAGVCTEGDGCLCAVVVERSADALSDT